MSTAIMQSGVNAGPTVVQCAGEGSRWAWKCFRTHFALSKFTLGRSPYSAKVLIYPANEWQAKPLKQIAIGDEAHGHHAIEFEKHYQHFVSLLAHGSLRNDRAYRFLLLLSHEMPLEATSTLYGMDHDDAHTVDLLHHDLDNGVAFLPRIHW